MSRTIRPADSQTVLAVEQALYYLQHARNMLRRADSPKTLERTRLAISSCRGALRHAWHRERRALQGSGVRRG